MNFKISYCTLKKDFQNLTPPLKQKRKKKKASNYEDTDKAQGQREQTRNNKFDTDLEPDRPNGARITKFDTWVHDALDPGQHN